MRESDQCNSAQISRALLVQWRVAAGAGLATVVACGLWILSSQGDVAALRWTLAAFVATSYLLWEFRRYLHQNIRSGEETMLPTLGAGTVLTLARGLLVALMAGFLVLERPEGALEWAPLILYFGAAVADFFDGYIARVRGHATKLGAALDISFDAFGTLVAVAALIHYGQLPLPFLLIGLLYYLFHGHMKLRERLGQPVVPLRPHPSRRMYAGFWFGYMAVALAPVLRPPWTVAAGYMFAAPLVAGFLVDWLFATAAISPNAQAWKKFEAAALRFIYRGLPVGLRLIVLAAGALWLAKGLSERGGWAPLFAALGWSVPSLPATLLALTGLTALAMTAAGWLGRLGALALISLATIDVVLRGSAPEVNFWLLSGSVGVLLLGLGRGILWEPENAFLMTQAGARNRPSRSEAAAA